MSRRNKFPGLYSVCDEDILKSVALKSVCHPIGALWGFWMCQRPSWGPIGARAQAPTGEIQMISEVLWIICWCPNLCFLFWCVNCRSPNWLKRKQALGLHSSDAPEISAYLRFTSKMFLCLWSGCVQERARRDSGEKLGAHSCYVQVIAKMKETRVSFVKTNLWALLWDPVLHHSTFFCCVFTCRYLSLQEVDSMTAWVRRWEAGGLGSSVPRWGFCVVKRNREPGWLFFHSRSVKLNFFNNRGQWPARLG